MTTNNCELIQDLIPLYSDGCASRRSQIAVREHLASCPECSAFAKSYSRASKISAVTNDKTKEFDIDIEVPYRNLAKKIRIRRRVNTAFTVGAIIVGAIVLTICADKYEKSRARKSTEL